jgi:SAM-dependent methyltransferase
MNADWTRYYDATRDEPRETLLFALEKFEAEDRSGLAVDLGCGTGRDTAELLRRGWSVLAIDGEEEAIARLRRRAFTDDQRVRLGTQIAPFDDAVWPPADLINASWSLPFCPPDRFEQLWEKLSSSLRAGGRFSGQLFGDRDEWASNPDLTFLTRAQAEALLEAFDAERFDEVEEDSTTAVGDPKHWHVYHVVARKR